MIEINGNYCEGGGQIARTALALSALTQKPFRVFDIRKGRKEPGLKSQHLCCIKALNQLCNAKTEGAELGSTSLLFAPSKLKIRNIEVDIGTAGSITLLLQSILPPILFGNKKMKIIVKGGTDCSWSPSLDYFSNVLLPHLKKFGEIDLKLIKRGFYPKGKGIAELTVSPKFNSLEFEKFHDFIKKIRSRCKKFDLAEQGKILAIKGISHASSELENAGVAERQAESAKSFLKPEFSCPIDIKAEYSETFSIGSVITLWAVFTKTDETDYNNPIILGADTLGERGKKAEEVGKEAAMSLIGEVKSNCAVDKHMADMLLPYMALLGGKIKASEITNHCKTNIYTIENFLGNIFSAMNDNVVECK